MKQFKNRITLVKNGRGCFILDTIKGCSVCAKDKPRGCYGDCYAKNIAGRYGMDFGQPVKRDFYRDHAQASLFDFEDAQHASEIIRAIRDIDMPFVRIGEMGDPSEDWRHTIDICETIALAGKPIVIITKHWKSIPRELYPKIAKMNICINTSISALDNDSEIIHRIIEYENMKDCCKSVLRIVSCDFNISNEEGSRRAEIQKRLFDKGRVIDTIFRPSVTNPLVTNGIINVQKVKFLKSQVLASVYNKDAYLGDCAHCPDLCGTALF
jgi:hypothetical protein